MDLVSERGTAPRAPAQPPLDSLRAARQGADAGSYRAARSVEDLTRRNVEAIHRLDQSAVERASAADRIAAFIAGYCGRISFVWAHVLFFGAWIALNSVPGLAFDPYPFTFLVLVVSLEAIFLSTFVLMSQNHEMRLAERRNQLDLQINLLTEQENTRALQLLQRIAERLGVPSDDLGLQALEEATRPERLAEQIDRAYRGRSPKGLFS